MAHRGLLKEGGNANLLQTYPGQVYSECVKLLLVVLYEVVC